MKSEKQLLEFYQKYINRPIYRVVPERTLKEVFKNGIDPNKNPYRFVIPKIKKVYQIVLRLEKRGIKIEFQRGKRIVTANFVCEECLTDLSKKYIDFCASKKQIDYYLEVIPGGGIPNAVRRLTKKMIELELPITKEEKILIENLNKWAESLICKNKVIYVSGSSRIFENALFQLSGSSKRKKRKNFSESKYLPSPFGSFEHFKKVVQKYGLIKYSYRLKNSNFYLRVKGKIPAKEIKLVSKAP